MVGKYLASGSTDEAIRLINMEKRVEHGFLQQQSGMLSISSLAYLKVFILREGLGRLSAKVIIHEVQIMTIVIAY